jgi:hypothetical protein
VPFKTLKWQKLPFFDAYIFCYKTAKLDIFELENFVLQPILAET